MNKVKIFLSNYPNHNTKRNLRIAITNFFKSVYGEAERKQLDDIADRYFSEERSHEADVETFLKHLNGQAPLTVKLKISNIKTFLLEYDIELPQKFWNKIRRRIKGSRALTLDRIPSNTEIRRLVTHMPIQGKALYLTLESSGMRVGEVLKSHIDDLYLEEKPARIQIRGEITKTGNSRHAFISSEAKEALTEWLKVREDYLRAASAKSHLHNKSVDDPRIFPFDPRTAYSIWSKALNKTKLNGRDKSTNRERIHPHTFRKFFRTKLGAVIPVDVVEALMGHEGYLTAVYRRYSLEDLKKFYLKGEPALLVFTDTQKVVELHKAIEEKNTQLQVLVNSLASENQNMKEKFAKVELENTDLKSRMSRVELENTEMMKRFDSAIQKLGEIEKLVKAS